MTARSLPRSLACLLWMAVVPPLPAMGVEMPFAGRFSKELSSVRAASGESADLPFLVSRAQEFLTPDVDVPFLQRTALGDEDKLAARFALCVLARTGGESARNALYAAIIERPRFALPVLIYAHWHDVRSIASRLIVEGQEPVVRMAGANLLAMVGDRGSAEALNRGRRDETDPSVQKAMEAAASRIQKREARLLEEERDGWYSQELRYAVLLSRASLHRSLEAGLGLAAQNATQKGETFSVRFLRARIQDRIGSDQMLAVALAGAQQEADLANDISGLAQQPGWEGNLARAALVAIGSDGAPKAIDKEMKPNALAGFEEDFAQALQDARKKMDRFQWEHNALSPYEPAGCRLASRYPEIGLEALEAKIADKDAAGVMNLGWVVLANLANRQEVKQLILQRALAGDRCAVLALSFMPAGPREEVARAVAVRGTDWRTRVDVVELLAHCGDADTIETLSGLQEKEENPRVREAMTQALRCLRTKLKQPASEREAWTACGLQYWRALREAPMTRLCNEAYSIAAHRLNEGGVRCPAPFLKCQVAGRDQIGIILAGIQREAELVPCLKDILSGQDEVLRRLAMVSLIRIGYEDAMDAIRDEMRPGDTEHNKAIAHLLSMYGTGSSVELLERLVSDEEYRASWPDFREAIKQLKQRIEQHKQAEPQPSSNTKP